MKCLDIQGFSVIVIVSKMNYLLDAMLFQIRKEYFRIELVLIFEKDIGGVTNAKMGVINNRNLHYILPLRSVYLYPFHRYTGPFKNVFEKINSIRAISAVKPFFFAIAISLIGKPPTVIIHYDFDVWILKICIPSMGFTLIT